MKFKIFEGGKLKEEMKRCVEEGYFPATISQIGKLIKSKKIPKQGYDTGNVIQDYKIRKITKKECFDLQKAYDDGVRVLFVGYYGSSGLSGDYDIDNYGRVLGVKK
jgi:hypothetical protein